MKTTLLTSTADHSADSDDDRASAWVALLDSPECTSHDRAEFDRWLDESPRHVLAYVEAERAHQAAAQLKDDELLQAAARIVKKESF